jgi:isochorismate hydrolase
VAREETYWGEIKAYNIRHANPRAEKAALLIIDMQVFLKRLAEPILPNVISLIDVCRRKGVLIVFTRHGDRDPADAYGMLYEWWQDPVLYGSPKWELLKELSAAPNDAIVDKTRYSAFFGTNLEDKLRLEGVEDLIICGVMSNLCCETTARDAFVRDYRVFFVADATATSHDDLHVASLKNLAYGFAYIMATEDICNNLK